MCHIVLTAWDKQKALEPVAEQGRGKPAGSEAIHSRQLCCLELPEFQAPAPTHRCLSFTYTAVVFFLLLELRGYLKVYLGAIKRYDHQHSEWPQYSAE